MKSSVESVEANKVKVRVEIDAAEFEKDIDAAFKRIAKEVRLPGFRPGKAPRRLLEARLGKEAGRQEALRESLPVYYSKAVIEHDVDVIAPPSIDITAGADDGPVAFDAVVEVRPNITLGGYRGLRVEIPSPFPSDEEVEEQIDRLRGQFSTLQAVERPIADGDQVTLDIEGTFQGDAVPGLTAADYLFEVGKGTVVPEIDENLRGATAGETLEFEANHPDPDEEANLYFVVRVKQVQEKVLPEVDEEFVKQASEFETPAELRADIERQLSLRKRAMANFAVRARTTQALGELVDDAEAPDAMISSEVQSRIEDLVRRLQAQNVSVEDYLSATGTSAEEYTANARKSGLEAVKIDLALRAIAVAEGIEATEEDMDKELSAVAEQTGLDVVEVLRRFTDSGQLSAVRSSLQKNKALEWLIDQVEIVDQDGTVIDRAALVIDEPSDAGGDAGVDDESVAGDA